MAEKSGLRKNRPKSLGLPAMSTASLMSQLSSGGSSVSSLAQPTTPPSHRHNAPPSPSPSPSSSAGGSNHYSLESSLRSSFPSRPASRSLSYVTSMSSKTPPRPRELITPPDEYMASLTNASIDNTAHSHTTSSLTTSSADEEIINNIIDETEDEDEASVTAAASLLMRQPSTRENSNILIDPYAFDEHSDGTASSAYNPSACSNTSLSITGGNNDQSSQSSGMIFGKAIFKKMVPSKIRQGLKRRMSAPIAPSHVSLPRSASTRVSPMSPLGPPVASSGSPAVHSQSQKQSEIDSYFDIGIASNTNLEKGLVDGSSVRPSSDMQRPLSRASSRHSLLLPATTPVTPVSPTALSNGPSSAASPGTPSLPGAMSSTAYVSSSAIASVMSSPTTGPITHHQLQLSAPDLSEIVTPLLSPPISQEVPQLESERTNTNITGMSGDIVISGHPTMQTIESNLTATSISANNAVSNTSNMKPVITPSTIIPENADEHTLRECLDDLRLGMFNEDQAFAATEARLNESGWTSHADMTALSHNRTATRRRWEQAIAAAQLQLDKKLESDL
ncbi:hypothetical protein V1511DRAFT_487762 [Dipodascopsis uninucleata]